MARTHILFMIGLAVFSNAACGDHGGTGGRGGSGGGRGGAEVDSGAIAVGGQGSGGAVGGGGGMAGDVGFGTGGTAGDVGFGTGGTAGDAAGDAAGMGDTAVADTAVAGTGGIGGGAFAGAGGSDAGGVAGQAGGAGGAVDSGAIVADTSASSEGGSRALDVAADDAAQAVDGQTVTGPADYLIIAADNLAASAARYRDFRRAGGLAVELAMVGDLVGDAADAAAASARIVEFVRTRYQARHGNGPMALLLLGDAQATWPGDRTGVPAGTWQATGTPVVSDNVYADVNGDDVPEIAVGRITADSDAELDLVRAKVAAYETTREIGVWDRRLGIFASTSGMGTLVDGLIEQVVYAITEAVPYDYDITMTYARQGSPYVYVPEQFSDQVYRRINEGSLLVTYVGHGYRDGFATLDWNGTSYPILDTSRLENLAVTHKSPILSFVACSTGAFVGSESVSEKILVRPDAPTAIMSSTEISDPYANAIFIYEMSQTLTTLRAATLGDAFLLAKQRMMSQADSVRATIESLGSLLKTASEREALKHSHLHMYMLFGDPGMAVVYPGRAEVAVTPASVSAGADLAVSATFPALVGDGEAIVTLESTRKAVLGTIAAVPPDGDPGRDAVIVKNYQTANDKVAVGLTVPVSGSSLSATLKAPAGLPAGQYHVKVFVQDGSNDYAGSAPLTVR